MHSDIRPGTYGQAHSARHRHNYCKYGKWRGSGIAGYGGG